MINPKNISICSAIGFFLSFFIGLVSPGVSFSHVLLRAVLCALLFAALCVGISFIYQKFLAAESNSFGVESDQNAQKTAGGVVNIVVDDSNLTDDGMAPKFTVLSNRAAPSPAVSSQSNLSPASSEAPAAAPEQSAPLSEPASPAPEPNAEPVHSAAPDSASSSSPQESSFKPASLASVTQKADAVQGSDAPVSSQAAPSESLASGSGGADGAAEQLDELPDIGSMDDVGSVETASDLSSAAEEVVTDTEFSTGGAHLKEQPISGDTNVMAKAIQTLLAKDND